MTFQHALIIGGQRCASTALASALNSHPNIQLSLPLRPEPKWFLTEGSERRLDEYRRTFFELDDATEGTVLIEKSTTYYETFSVIDRIGHAFQDPRLIVILRDPVERALSNYRFSKQNGLETRSAREALDPAGPVPRSPSGISTNPFDYLYRSRFEVLLDPWVRRFGSRLLIVSLKDLVDTERAESTFNRLFKHLGVIPVASGPLFRENASEGTVPEGAGGLQSRLAEYFSPTYGWAAEMDLDL